VQVRINHTLLPAPALPDGDRTYWSGRTLSESIAELETPTAGQGLYRADVLTPPLAAREGRLG